MTKVKRIRRVAVGVVAVAMMVGIGVGSLPKLDRIPVRATAVIVDPAALYNTAQARFAARDVAGGLAALKQVLAVAPFDADALALQSIWADQANDVVTSLAAMNRLTIVNPILASTARNIISGVAAAAKIVPSTTPKPVLSGAAIVVLGYGLNANGAMAPELVNRLTAGKSQADVSPLLPIVVTGGAPKRGITEASAMYKWLIANGVAASRVVAEDKSGSTVANAQNTAAILALRGIRNVVLVTSPNHIRRGAADFAAAGLRVVATVTTPTDLARYAAPLTRDQQTGIRLEATRTAKIPVTKQIGVRIQQNLPDPGPDLIYEIGGKILRQLLAAGSSNS
ncbi:MAG: YdcF family protein [Gordonia sp. (in: high G+C Gram-positive bacteria)]